MFSSKNTISKNHAASGRKERVQKVDKKVRRQGLREPFEGAHRRNVVLKLASSQLSLPLTLQPSFPSPTFIRLHTYPSQNAFAAGQETTTGLIDPQERSIRTQSFTQNYGSLPTSRPYLASLSGGCVSDPEVGPGYYNKSFEGDQFGSGLEQAKKFSSSCIDERSFFQSDSLTTDRVYSGYHTSMTVGSDSREASSSISHGYQRNNTISETISHFNNTIFQNQTLQTLYPSSQSCQSSDWADNHKKIKSKSTHRENTHGFYQKSSRANGNVQNDRHSKIEDVSPAPSPALRAATVGVAGLWIGPLVVLYWCNTWHITERYVFPDNKEMSAWVCSVFGFGVLTLVTCLQMQISSFILGFASSGVQWSLTCVYTYIMAIACVCQWRGLWALMDHYLGVTMTTAAVSTAIAVGLMLLMRCYLSVLATPAVISPDIPRDKYFSISTFFSVKPDTRYIVWDSLFTVVIVGSLLVSVWRGFWEMMDARLFPNSATNSALVCTALSYCLYLVLSLIQDRLSRFSAYLDSIHWFLKLILEDFVYLVQSIICITHWRGLWFLLDRYDPYRPSSLWVGHAVSFLLLAVTLSAQNLMVRGCATDGAQPEGKGIQMNTSYMGELRRWYRSKKAGKAELTS